MKRPLNICIVDDDIDVRLSLKDFFRSAGMDAHVFSSAEGFLEWNGRIHTDCLITDLHMDGMDGIALQETLQREQCKFPVIVMTAFPSEAAEHRALTLGAAAFLQKPVDPDSLLERVERILA